MSETDSWRYVYASVPGVSHLAAGVECQDACAALLTSTLEADPLLLLVAADGAGSAAQARSGAELACRVLLEAFVAWLAAATPAQWHPAFAASILDSVRTALHQQASTAGVSVREFACTLLGAAVSTECAFFLQIGDGAIVIRTDEHYRPVFWPQSGQYINETHFVTDPDAEAHLECAIITEPIKEIALLTDGLQSLALHYQQQQAHEPFFRPLFQTLHAFLESGREEALTAALERFLDSPAINQRTHDDKTLVLATCPALAVKDVPAEPPIAVTPSVLQEDSLSPMKSEDSTPPEDSTRDANGDEIL